VGIGKGFRGYAHTYGQRPGCQMLRNCRLYRTKRQQQQQRQRQNQNLSSQVNSQLNIQNIISNNPHLAGINNNMSQFEKWGFYCGGFLGSMVLGLVGCDMYNHFKYGRSYFRDIAIACNPPSSETTNINHNRTVINNQYGAVNNTVNRNDSPSDSCSCNLNNIPGSPGSSSSDSDIV